MGKQNEDKLVKRIEEFNWKNHIIKIIIRLSPRFRPVFDLFLYVDNELIANTTHENVFETLRQYKMAREKPPKNIKGLLWKQLKSDAAEGYFDHLDKRIPIKVEMKTNLSPKYRGFKDMFSLFGSCRYFLLEINGTSYTIGKREVPQKYIGEKIPAETGQRTLVSKPFQLIIGFLFFVLLLIADWQRFKAQGLPLNFSMTGIKFNWIPMSVFWMILILIAIHMQRKKR